MKRSIIALLPLPIIKIAILPLILVGFILHSCTQQGTAYASNAPDIEVEEVEADIVLNEDNAVFYQECGKEDGAAENTDCTVEQIEKPEEYAKFEMMQPFANLNKEDQQLK